MLLALASYVSTAQANTPHCNLDLLYHDGRAHSLDKRFLTGLSSSRAAAHTRLTLPRARTWKAWTGCRRERRAWRGASMAPSRWPMMRH